jgi:uncharacterized protein (DUF885 family)
MMQPRYLIASFLVVTTLLPVPVVLAEESAAERLDAVVEEYFEQYLQLYPLFATRVGDDRYNDRLPDLLSAAGRVRELEMNQRCLEQLQAIDPAALDGERWITRQVLARELELAIAGHRFPDHLLPVSDAMTSLPVYLPSLASDTSNQPFRNSKDYDDFLARIAAFSPWVDQAIANMQEGIRQGITQPRSVIERALPQLARMAMARGRSSSFYEPIKRLPEAMPRDDRKRLAEAYRRVISDQVCPAYARLHRFLKEEYLPKCRTTIGMVDLPNGAEWYRYHVRYYTTTDIDPDEILRIGLEELNQVLGEIGDLVVRAGYETHPQRFFNDLQGRGQQLTSAEQLLEEYRKIGKRVEQQLAAVLGHLPATRLAIEPVTRSLMASSPGAFYQSARPGGELPGVFFVNTGYIPYRRYSMESLFLHEGVPGHHLQLSLAQEQTSLPRYRRFLYQGAFIEGWALYAESLGKRLGLYTDPFQEYGRLRMELLRSARLVADVGIHGKGWSRDQVTQVLQERSLGVGCSEIDRYIAWPGQALGYKIGELRIQALRRRAEEVLGEGFDLAAFHDELLSHGALPLDILDQVIKRWLERIHPPAQSTVDSRQSTAPPPTQPDSEAASPEPGSRGGEGRRNRPARPVPGHRLQVAGPTHQP